MSGTQSTLKRRGVRIRLPAAKVSAVLLLLVVAVGLLYNLQTLGYFMHDDEGSYAYAAWRVSLGEVPYRDFLTPQLPAFLYWGGLLVSVFGRSLIALRLATILSTGLAAWLLYRIDRELGDSHLGFIAAILFLLEPNVFHSGRFFRAEAYMLLLDLAGVYAFILAEKRRRPAYTWLAGFLFGLATTFKLFGAFALAGCGLYLLYTLWRERRPFRQVVQSGLALGIPAVLWAAAIALIFTHETPYFFTAVFEHHLMQGAGLTLLQRVDKALDLYNDYVFGQPVAMVLAAFGAAALLRRRKALPSLLLWQAPMALTFLFLSRDLMLRHFTYLAPTLATLAALPLARLWTGHWRIPGLSKRWPGMLLAAALAFAVLFPWMKENLHYALVWEDDSPQLAALIRSLSPSDAPVIADYPGLNFLAGRATTYWAAGLSGGAAQSGQIGASALIGEIEQQQAAGVVINVLGNDHQMTLMPDYAEFRRYVQQHFFLVDRYQCSYRVKELEIYSRSDTMPLQPNIDYQGQVALTGARLSADTVQSGDALQVDTRWRALARMPRDYHLSLRLVDATGHVWTQLDEPLVEQFTHIENGDSKDTVDNIGTSGWEPGQVVLRKHSLALDPSLPSGTYWLIARVYDLETGYALVAQPGQGPTLPAGDTVIASVRVNSPAGLDPSVLPVASPMDVMAGDGLELLGVGDIPASITAGRALGLEVFWRATQQLEADQRLILRLMQGGNECQRWQEEPVEGFATSTWEPGQVLLGHYLLPLASDLATGRYDLQGQVVDAEGQPVGQPVSLGEVGVEARPDPAQLKEAISHRLEGVTFGEGIRLLGYDLEPSAVQAGGTVELTLYWECLQTPAQDYKVFTHLLDGAMQIQGQRDAIPEDGASPTSGWQVGDVLADHYPIAVEATAAGELQVEVGFYDPLTGERLPLLQDGAPTGADYAVLPSAVVVAE